MLRTKEPTLPPPNAHQPADRVHLDHPNDATYWRLAPEPTSSIVTVTPAIAHIWLQFNTDNRRKKPSELDRYARDMAAGNWKLNGEAIKFARSGRLLDGQNRLMACVKADVPFVTYVMRGLEDVAQRTMDSGAKRTSADDLQMFAGEDNPTMLAAVTKLALTADQVGIERAGRHSVSNLEIAAFLDEYPELRDAVVVAKETARQIDAFPAVVGYAYWNLSHLDEAAAREFFKAAATKVGLAEGDPILAMAKRFAEARRNRERLPHSVQLSVIYRAWNARREGKSMKFIRVKSPKSGDVPIPEPR